MEFGKFRNYLFLSLLGGVTVLFFYIIKPFFYALFWAAVLAALFTPLLKRVDRKLKHRTLSTLVTLLVIALILILPLFIIGTLLVNEAAGIYDAVRNNRGQFAEAISGINYFLYHNNIITRFGIDEATVTARVGELSQWLLDFVVRSAQTFTQSSLEFAALFLIMMYSLFYFLRDGDKMLHKLMYLLPLGDRNEMKLYKKFTATSSATIRGTLLVGGLQGSLGGILFAITGIPGAIIWGIIMTLFSIIPATGSFLIWLPAGIIMLATGHLWQGILILIVGALVISVIDNLLRPILVGKDLSMHPLIILFSTLGGLVMFGITGFIIGPIVASLFLSFWEMYEEYYRTELEKN